MALESIQVSAVIPAAPHDVYEAWLDGGMHGAMTGGHATVEPVVGGKHTAWDGYIEGTTLALDPGRRIVQSWRTLDFPAGAADSRLEISLHPVEGGTELTLHHSEIPEGQAGEYEEGWVDHYFRPMAQYFSERKSGFPVPQTEDPLPQMVSESMAAVAAATEWVAPNEFRSAGLVESDSGFESETSLDRGFNGVGDMRVVHAETEFSAAPTTIERLSARPRVSTKRKVASSTKLKPKAKAKAAAKKVKAKAKSNAKRKSKAKAKKTSAGRPKKLAAKRKVAPKKAPKKAGKRKKNTARSKAKARG